MIHMRGVSGDQLRRALVRKMAPPLVTLLSSPPEVQWVALRNINLLLQKEPGALSNEMRVFFCKYNDPLYVKVEKLDIMVRLANENNIDPLLSELKEWVSLRPHHSTTEYSVQVRIRSRCRLREEEHKSHRSSCNQD